jgi:hypothetical protein
MRLFLCALALVGCGGQIDSSTDAGAEGGSGSDASAADVIVTPDASDAACPADTKAFNWFISGSSPSLYQGGHDPTTTCSGAPSVSLKSVSKASSSDFATMMTTQNAASFVGKRVRFRGWARTDSLDTWAGLWMRVDRPNQQMGAFDNMANRPIKGTTPWTQYDVVLDIAPDAVDIAFGILLSGNGATWLDGVDVAIVDDSVPVTGN